MTTYNNELLDKAVQLGSSTLYEASGVSTSSVDPAIQTIWPGAAIAGPAYPVECAPGDNLAIHVAMEKAPRGSILVVSTGGFVAGYWGEVLTVAAEAAGVKGLIIDGGVRDIVALKTRCFPTFSRGISVRGTIKASVPSVGEPMDFAGTPVKTGDLVVADDDGVIIIPSEKTQHTMDQGLNRFDKEEVMMEELRAGKSTLNLMGLSQWSELS